MAQFGNLTITTKGLQLQAKAQLGTQLAFTRVAFGDGQLPEGQKLIDLTNMISEKITSPITSIDVIGDGTTRIRAALSNNNLNQGFYLREVGVFATDPAEGEILYAIANAGTYPDFLPAGTGSTIVETTMDLITIVGNATNVTARIDESLTYTTVADFNEKVGNVAELSNGQIVKELKSHASSLAEKSQQISALDTNKADKTEVNVLATEKANQSDVETLSSTKVDKGGSEQITYSMLAQDVKTQFTGGNTAVVGVESTGLTNLTTEIQDLISSFEKVTFNIITDARWGYDIADQVTQTGYYACSFSCSAGERYKLTAILGDHAKTILFLDSSGNILSRVADALGVANYTDYAFTIPTGCILCKFSTTTATPTLKKATLPTNGIKDVFNYLNGIFEVGSTGTFSFSKSDTTISVTLPSVPMFFIKNNAETIPSPSSYYDTTFSISSSKLLVWDLASNTISVISDTTSKSDLNIPLLVNINGKITDGYLKSWYDRWEIDNNISNLNISNLNGIDLNDNFLSIQRLGDIENYPENTLLAYKGSRKLGFKYAGVDVAVTSDGVLVLLHDETINRTGRNADGTSISNTIKITDITYEQALQYDFGIMKSSEFAGTKIPTFEEFIIYAKKIGIKPTIEFKYGMNEIYVKKCIDIVKKYGMIDNVIWNDVKNTNNLLYVAQNYSKAKIILTAWTLTSEVSSYIDTIKTSDNEVILFLKSTFETETGFSKVDFDSVIEKGIRIMLFTVDTKEDILSLISQYPYICGMESNYYIAGNVLYNNAIS